jgi:hypothetical protein
MKKYKITPAEFVAGGAGTVIADGRCVHQSLLESHGINVQLDMFDPKEVSLTDRWTGEVIGNGTVLAGKVIKIGKIKYKEVK